MACTLVLAAASVQAAGHAHQHGVARLDVAVDARRITLHLDSPLDNLVGFEHAPRTDAERRLAAEALAALRSPGLFAIDPAAQCRPAEVTLESAALGLGPPDPHDEDAGHADLDADFAFDCADAAQAAFIDVGLFGFARLQRIEVQLATPAGQFRRDLARPARRIVLVK